MGLDEIARQVRELTVRAIKNCGSGHPGGSLSAVEIMVLLHCEVMRPQPYHPDQAQDIFILSGGHKCPALYALWGVLGWVDPDSVLTLRKLGSPFQGHPSYQHTPWIHASSGSLGQACAVAVGYALAYHRAGLDKIVYCLVGEGDLNEGITTEALRIAAYYKLTNFVLIVDYNRRMSDRHSKVMVNPGRELEGLGFMVEPCNGHLFSGLRASFQMIESKPTAIVAHTVKGYPVPAWMDDPDGAHGSLTLSQDDLDMALGAING